jgi:hypothetical protein
MIGRIFLEADATVEKYHNEIMTVRKSEKLIFFERM